MSTNITALIAITCYLAGAILQYFYVTRRDNSSRVYVLYAGIAGLFFHAFSIGEMHTDAGISLGLYNILSVTGWLIALLVVVSSWRKPLHSLLLAIYPLAAGALVLNLVLNGTRTQSPLLNMETASHILLSVLAYATLTVASVQALILAIQDHHLRHQHPSGFIMQLPPLQVMEQLLFEFIWVGILLLTASIFSGFLFLENMFAQHVAHKTILSIIAWGLFSMLLAGRHWLGWRGTTAIRWTLGGYLLLMLAFIGTKLVLEVILNR